MATVISSCFIHIERIQVISQTNKLPGHEGRWDVSDGVGEGIAVLLKCRVWNPGWHQRQVEREEAMLSAVGEMLGPAGMVTVPKGHRGEINDLQ